MGVRRECAWQEVRSFGVVPARRCEERVCVAGSALLRSCSCALDVRAEVGGEAMHPIKTFYERFYGIAACAAICKIKEEFSGCMQACAENPSFILALLLSATRKMSDAANATPDS